MRGRLNLKTFIFFLIWYGVFTKKSYSQVSTLLKPTEFISDFPILFSGYYKHAVNKLYLTTGIITRITNNKGLNNYYLNTGIKDSSFFIKWATETKGTKFIRSYRSQLIYFKSLFKNSHAFIGANIYHQRFMNTPSLDVSTHGIIGISQPVNKNLLMGFRTFIPITSNGKNKHELLIGTFQETFSYSVCISSEQPFLINQLTLNSPYHQIQYSFLLGLAPYSLGAFMHYRIKNLQLNFGFIYGGVSGQQYPINISIF